MTTYSPSGAPGNVRVYFEETSFLDRIFPRGCRKLCIDCFQLSAVTALLKKDAASVPLSAYILWSIRDSQARAAASAVFSLPESAKAV